MVGLISKHGPHNMPFVEKNSTVWHQLQILYNLLFEAVLWSLKEACSST